MGLDQVGGIYAAGKGKDSTGHNSDRKVVEDRRHRGAQMKAPIETAIRALGEINTDQNMMGRREGGSLKVMRADLYSMPYKANPATIGTK